MLLNLLNFYLLILQQCFSSVLFIVPLGICSLILVVRIFYIMGGQ